MISDPHDKRGFELERLRDRLRNARCVRCNTKPDEIRVSAVHYDAAFAITVECHGAIEIVQIPFNSPMWDLVFFRPSPNGYSSCRRATIRELVSEPTRKIVIS